MGNSTGDDVKQHKAAISKILGNVSSGLAQQSSDTDIAQRLAWDVKSSQDLSAVWTLPPAQLLRFRPETPLARVDGTQTPGFKGGKKRAQRFINLSAQISNRYQLLLYANGAKGSPQRVLIILQGMDAAGKGGIVRHVFGQGDPMGIHYHGFGAPNEEERRHDFLWRIRRQLPKPGWIAVFDRSQYEDIVMPHIYGTYPPKVWQPRYDQINAFEHELVTSGCTVIKVFLVISKDEQKRHFLKRLTDPTKFWKFDESDLEARSRWDEYMQAWQ